MICLFEEMAYTSSGSSSSSNSNSESLSPQVVSAANLPILNPNEFDLWKMMIEQYFLMTDYSLWEVILNGDSPILIRVIDGFVQPVAPTTAEQRLARKNKLKAQGTLLMALPGKHQLKFNIHKDAKTLMEAIKKWFSGNKENKKVQKTLLKQQYKNFTGSSSESLDQIHDRMQKLIISDVASVSAASTKVPISALPNVDTLSDAVIYSFFASQSNSPQLDNDDLKKIDADDLEDMDLKLQMVMLTMRARIFLQRTERNLGANGTTSIRFDMSKVECYNCHKRGHFARECRSPKDNKHKETQKRNVPVETSTSNALVLQYDGVGSYDWSFQAEEEPTNYALMAFTSLSSSNSDNELRDNALVDSRKKFEKARQERDELKLKLDKFQTSSRNLSQLLASQTNDKTGLGYHTQVFNSSVYDCDEMFSSESDVSMPASPVYDRYKSREGYHAVPPPYTGTFMPPKPDLVFHDAPTVNETVLTAFNVEPNESEGEPMPTQKAPSFVHTTEHVKTPSLSVNTVKHPIPAEFLRKDIPKSRGHSNRRNRKACFVCKSLTHLIKDCNYYEKKMVPNPVRNHAMRGNHHHSVRMTNSNPQRHVVPTAVLTRSRLVSLNTVRPVNTDVPQTKVTRPRPVNTVVTRPHSPLRRPINLRPSPNPSTFPQKVTNVKALQVNVVKGVKENWIQVSYGLGPKEKLTFLFLMQSNPHHALKYKGVIDNGCSRHMTWNMPYLSEFEEINGGYVAFGGNPNGGKITGKGKIKIGKLDFDDVYFVKELKLNLFSDSQMCDKKNIVLFTDTECIILSSDFKLPDENHVLLRVPRENNMYNVDLKNIVPSGDLTCLFVKATLDESNLGHRRLGHINFKIMNKLVTGNLVRGLPSKVFENNHTCVACKKGKQHRASCKSKPVSSVSQPLQRLHMDLFGPTIVKSLNKKSYCLVVTDDYSRFSWVFFLATKDENSPILKTIITGIENQLSLKVKIIRSDNRTKFKNHDLNQFCGMKGIKREFSVARTPQQNGIAERKNRILIEAARTVLAYSLLPIPFWAEAVNTACYVQNRVLVTEPYNKTPYELLLGRTPSIGFLRPFGCIVTILNTLDPLGEFDGKADEGFLVGYSVSNNTGEEIAQQYVLFPLWSFGSKDPQNTDGDTIFEVKEPESDVHVSPSSSAKTKKHDDKTTNEAKGKSHVELSTGFRNLSEEFEYFSDNSTNEVNCDNPSNSGRDLFSKY
nr:putative ribonuclease H-like domain-containing protein [Tanacetum cinerariifolium]